MRQERARGNLPAQDAGWLALEDSTVVATLIVGEGGEVLAANAKTRELLGAPSARAMTGINLHDLLVDADDWREWQAVFSTGVGSAVTQRLRKPHGAEIVLRGDLRVAAHGRAGHGRCVVGTFVDATRERQLTRAVQQSARMEALGSLTAGISHDFNNLLTILVGNLSLVAEDVRGDERVFAKVKPARDAAKRGADLIRQLLTFARREDAEVGVIEVGRVVTDLGPLLERALGPRIAFKIEVTPGPWPVRSSVAQLESVIVNLAVNSRDAITGKGQVTVRVGEHAGPAEGAGAARYVAVQVADDGCGIPPNLLERVFDPFFSTKLERGGTGLGLSMVRWFAEGVNGFVRAESVVGEGTTITLLLPRSIETHVDTTDGTAPLSTLPPGKERVLVLAPDEGLRSMITQILEVLGYTVRTAGEAGSLAGLLHGYAADLLILDAQLCGRAQSEWLAGALVERPDLKVIVTSDRGLPDSARALGASSLQKPFSLADLAKVVRVTLDRRARPDDGLAVS